jgi:hypothetical protein
MIELWDSEANMNLSLKQILILSYTISFTKKNTSIMFS